MKYFDCILIKLHFSLHIVLNNVINSKQLQFLMEMRMVRSSYSNVKHPT